MSGGDARFGTGGQAVWDAYAEAGLTAPQVAVLEEACRAKDRLDKLDKLLSGEVETWARLTHRTRTDDYELIIDDALAKANATASGLRQLLATLPAVQVQRKRTALDEFTQRRRSRGAASAGVSRPRGTGSG